MIIVMHNNYYMQSYQGCKKATPLLMQMDLYNCIFVGNCMTRSMPLTGQYRTDCPVTRHMQEDINEPIHAVRGFKSIKVHSIQENQVSDEYGQQEVLYQQL